MDPKLLMALNILDKLHIPNFQDVDITKYLYFEWLHFLFPWSQLSSKIHIKTLYKPQ